MSGVQLHPSVGLDLIGQLESDSSSDSSSDSESDSDDSDIGGGGGGGGRGGDIGGGGDGVPGNKRLVTSYMYLKVHRDSHFRDS